MELNEEQIHKNLYGDPEKIIHYMDYTNGQADNSWYVPDLVPGVLQLLEINEIIEPDPKTDELLSKLDIEKIVQDAEKMTSDSSNSK